MLEVLRARLGVGFFGRGQERGPATCPLAKEAFDQCRSKAAVPSVYGIAYTATVLLVSSLIIL